jgi:hypothetical protein
MLQTNKASEHSIRVLPIETDGESRMGPHLQNTVRFMIHKDNRRIYSKSATRSPFSVAPLRIVVELTVGMNELAETEM